MQLCSALHIGAGDLNQVLILAERVLLSFGPSFQLLGLFSRTTEICPFSVLTVGFVSMRFFCSGFGTSLLGSRGHFSHDPCTLSRLCMVGCPVPLLLPVMVVGDQLYSI